LCQQENEEAQYRARRRVETETPLGLFEERT
jgi:hypothetical protein